MADNALSDELESYLTGLGATFVASADLTVVPDNLHAELPVGVLIGRALDPEVVAGIEHGPTPDYAAEYSSVNSLLESLAVSCADFLARKGYASQPGIPSGDDYDERTLTTLLPHKTVATLAGAGWIGKCALLVTRRWGSAVRINTVLTDAPLPTGNPVSSSKCGDCKQCVAACPAGAPAGTNWSPGLLRDEYYDAGACQACARRLAVNAGSSHSICGICIAACPHTQTYLNRSRIA